jgi:AbrB family looped-hinge helix DNA binding protein
METTRLSTKGQLVLPKGIRVSRAWGPGTEFTVEETEEGILLRPAGHFSDASLEDMARFLFASEPIWIAKTVLLETGWVLRSLYGLDQSAIHAALTKLLGLKNVHAEDEAAVAAALALYAQGIELADAMHLASRPRDAVFVSFDKSFVQRAKRAGVPDISGMLKN